MEETFVTEEGPFFKRTQVWRIIRNIKHRFLLVRRKS